MGGAHRFTAAVQRLGNLKAGQSGQAKLDDLAVPFGQLLQEEPHRVPLLPIDRQDFRRGIGIFAGVRLVQGEERAASAVEMAMTRGIARPKAWGQAITSTVTVRSIAWSGSPRASQTAAVMRPAPTAK